jgi:hypothetical protein
MARLLANSQRLTAHRSGAVMYQHALGVQPTLLQESGANPTILSETQSESKREIMPATSPSFEVNPLNAEMTTLKRTFSGWLL